MMAEAVPIRAVPEPTVADEIRADAIAKLREALEIAEKGDVEEVLIIMKHAGEGDSAWSNIATATLSFSRWIGYLNITIADWIEEYRRVRHG